MNNEDQGSKTFPLRLSVSLHKELKTKAFQEERSMRSIVVEALETRLKGVWGQEMRTPARCMK